jgi:hypothetical protein
MCRTSDALQTSNKIKNNMRLDRGEKNVGKMRGTSEWIVGKLILFVLMPVRIRAVAIHILSVVE